MTTTQKTNYGVNEIAKLFPSLLKIKEKSLREKVAAVWNEAITTGCGGKGWTFAELRAVKFTLLAGDIDMKFVEHLNSCARPMHRHRRCAEEIVPLRAFRFNAIISSPARSWPMSANRWSTTRTRRGNVVQGTFGQQLRHPFSGVALAYKHGIPGEVMHMIATHSHEGDKVERSIESIIFHHADFVDFDIAKLLGKRAAKK